MKFFASGESPRLCSLPNGTAGRMWRGSSLISTKNFAASGGASRAGARRTSHHLQPLESNDACWVSYPRSSSGAIAWELAAFEAA